MSDAADVTNGNKFPGHKFVPGTEVFVKLGYGAGATYSKHTVTRLYRSGRFVIDDRTGGQWRAGSDGSTAVQAGRGRSTYRAHKSLVLVTPESTALRQQSVDRQNKSDRLYRVQLRIERLRAPRVSDEFLDAVETALNTHHPEGSP